MKLRSAQEQKRKNVPEEKVFSLLRSQRLTRKKVPTNQVNSRKRLKYDSILNSFLSLKLLQKPMNIKKKGRNSKYKNHLSPQWEKNNWRVFFPLYQLLFKMQHSSQNQKHNRSLGGKNAGYNGQHSTISGCLTYAYQSATILLVFQSKN